MNTNKPAKWRYTENKRAQLKKWCKFAEGFKGKGRKTNGSKTRPSCIKQLF
jgi:hypothetical protein